MSDDKAPFELKSSTITLPLMRLHRPQMEAVARHLAAKVAEAPEFFHNTPVVIELSELAGQAVDFPLLVGLLRGYDMIPVGVRGGSPEQNDAAQLMELAILGQKSERPPPEKKPPAAANEANPERTAAPPKANLSESLVVDRPVRSGQRLYASGGDLIITTSVSPGAELMADGHIHVYGTLRGRALAGVKGNQAARIFCYNLQAELIAIAGNYKVNEDLDREFLGRAVQVQLLDRALQFQTL